MPVATKENAEKEAEQEVGKEKEEEAKPLTDDELREILKKKIVEYKVLGDYGESRPSTLKIKRWPWGVGMNLAPMTIQIFSSVLSGMFQEQGRIEFDLTGIFSKENLGHVLASNFDSLSKIIAKTLTIEKSNGFKDEIEALEFVKEFEVFDVVNICKILFEQNFEFVLKNVFGGTATISKGLKNAAPPQSKES